MNIPSREFGDVRARTDRAVGSRAGVKTFGEVDLDVSGSTLRVREKAGRRRAATVALPFAVDASSAAAKFSKKRSQLTVTLTKA